ncbi:MAG: family 16 glycosylhydrolase [Phycisphaerales bacterium]
MKSKISRLPASVALSAAILAVAGMANAQRSALPGWRLVWAEEFTGSALDTARWNSENIAWPYNSELQFYLPQQATVQSGVLDIKAERRNHGGRAYVSARINTDNKFEQQYGRFEARMKVPAGQGLWPAFWLLPATDAWPPEIDIMETVGGQPNRVYLTHHWGTVDNVMSHGTTFDGPDFTANYHRYAVEWGPNRVDWLVDGVQRFSVNANFPREPMYIILNMAVGGNLPGNPNPTTPFPSSTLVDWVRVYQRDVPLANPGFEDGTLGGPVALWQSFGNAQQSSSSPRTGQRNLRLFGNGGSGTYYAGVFQDLPAAPGQVWRATGFARHTAAERLTGGTFVDLKIEWYDHTGAPLGVAITTALTPGSALDTHLPSTVQATAPPGTATARVAVVYVQPPGGGGAATIDDLTFTYISPAAITVCDADFNGVGGLTIQDLFDFFAAYFAADPRADFTSDRLLTVQDLFDFLESYFLGC